MNRKTWDGFMCSTGDRYKLYLYLVTAHSLGTPVLYALNQASVFRSERFWLDAFVVELGKTLVRDGWRGSVYMRDAEYNTEWDGSFTRGEWSVWIREDPCVSVWIRQGYNSGIRYVWREGYRITRNKMAITRDELLERIVRDIR